MNIQLQREILLHVLHLFGGFSSPSPAHLKQHKSEKKISFEVEGKLFQNAIWSGEKEIDGEKVRFILADLSEEVPEFALIIRLNDFPPYLLNISMDNEDLGSFMVLFENKWIAAPTLLQAQVLVAVENLFDRYTPWNPLKDITSMYSILTNFLKSEMEDA